MYIYAFMSFTFHVRTMALVCRISLDIVLMLCFDNGSVHHLVVGSEPTHCDGYLSLCILHIDACWYPPFEGMTFYGLCYIYCFYRLLISRALFPCLV